MAMPNISRDISTLVEIHNETFNGNQMITMLYPLRNLYLQINTPTPIFARFLSGQRNSFILSRSC